MEAERRGDKHCQNASCGVPSVFPAPPCCCDKTREKQAASAGGEEEIKQRTTVLKREFIRWL